MNSTPFNKIKLQYNQYSYFVFILTVFFLLFFIIQNINNRFWLHDYEVYYSAATSFIKGNQLYGIAFGLPSGFYKYSPFGLLIFAPATLLPFPIAKFFHFIILSVAIIYSIILTEKIIRKYILTDKNINLLNFKLGLVFMISLSILYRELHLGNINIILLLISIIALQMLLDKKEIIAGILLSFVILLKPHFIILIPLLLMRKKYYCTVIVLISIFIGLLLPSLFVGLHGNLILHDQWLNAMMIHNESLIDGHDTIYSWIYFSIVHFFYPEAINHDKIYGIIILSLIAVSIFSLILLHFKKEKSDNYNIRLMENNFIFEFFLLLSLIPNITITDTEHFLFSIPLIIYLIYCFSVRKLNLIMKIFIFLALISFGINIHDLVGKEFSAWLTVTGILGLSNIAIILLSLTLHSFYLKENYQSN